MFSPLPHSPHGACTSDSVFLVLLCCPLQQILSQCLACSTNFRESGKPDGDANGPVLNIPAVSQGWWPRQVPSPPACILGQRMSPVTFQAHLLGFHALTPGRTGSDHPRRVVPSPRSAHQRLCPKPMRCALGIPPAPWEQLCCHWWPDLAEAQDFIWRMSSTENASKSC